MSALSVNVCLCANGGSTVIISKLHTSFSRMAFDGELPRVKESQPAEASNNSCVIV